MSIAEREQQILRVKKQGFHKELDEALADKLTTEVVSTVKMVLESALDEEVKAFLKPLTEKERPHRSGYYRRGLNTQYGRIQDSPCQNYDNETENESGRFCKGMNEV